MPASEARRLPDKYSLIVAARLEVMMGFPRRYALVIAGILAGGA